MMEEFWEIIEALDALETSLRNAKRSYAATQVHVLRGFLQVIYLSVLTNGPDKD